MKDFIKDTTEFIDRESLDQIERILYEGSGLTDWEVEFLEDKQAKVSNGKNLSEGEKNKLIEIEEERL